MNNVRDAISCPLLVDLSSMPVPPLKFFVQVDHSPAGILERISGGMVLSHYPWYTQVTVGLEGLDADIVLYLLPKDDSSALLIACLDEIVDPVYSLMTGPDFGDELSTLVALRWPELFGMLLNSQTQKPSSRMLIRVGTPERLQWAVADELRGRNLQELSHERIGDLFGTSLETFFRTCDPGQELAGLTEVLGGPNRALRLLGTVADILGCLTTAIGVIGGTATPLDIFNSARGARDAFKSVKKDWM